MPGTKIGRGCLIGAGTVVRGEIPDYSIVVGSPGQIIGDTREHIASQFKHLGLPETDLMARDGARAGLPNAESSDPSPK